MAIERLRDGDDEEVDEREERDEETTVNRDQEAELPGPVQLYLQEIGAVRLLTAKEEVEIAKEIENGRLLARLQRDLTALGKPLSYESQARYLLQRLLKLTERVRHVVAADDVEKCSDILFDPSLQRSIEAQIDTDLAEAIADVVG